MLRTPPDAAPPRRRPGELCRLVTDPRDRSLAAERYLGVMVASLVVALLALALAVTPYARSAAWGVALAAAVTAAALVRPFRQARRQAARSGDDLIGLIVTGDGLVVAGGLEIGWSEVLQVRVVRRDGASSTGRGWHLDLHVGNAASLQARARTPLQRAALADGITPGSGRVRVELGPRLSREAGALLVTLERECGSRGIPVVVPVTP